MLNSRVDWPDSTSEELDSDDSLEVYQSLFTNAPVAMAISALAIKALVQQEDDPFSNPAVVNGLRFLLAGQRDDGAFDRGALANYVTSTVVSALAAIDKERYSRGMKEAGIETTAEMRAKQKQEKKAKGPAAKKQSSAGAHPTVATCQWGRPTLHLPPLMS